jgi:L-threonylcarbamoyladenylate synthase
VSDVVSIERDGAEAARAELERCVRDGRVAIFPADTLYGLACDPLNRAPVERINRMKGRDPRKPSAVMFFSASAMRELVEDLGPLARKAVDVLLPGPATTVVDNAGRRYELACGADPGKIGVRLIEGPLAGLEQPVLQTSANRSGAPAPARFEDLPEGILASADLVIDGGELGGAPSTVVDLSGIDSGAGWGMLREGAMGESEVTRRLGALPRRLG